MNDYLLAYLPAVGMFFYVLLDLWEHVPKKFARKIGVLPKFCFGFLIVICAVWVGGAQLTKSRAEAAESREAREQLSMARSEVTSMHSDMRILEANLVSKMEGDQRIFTAMTKAGASLPVMMALADEYKQPLVTANGSKNLNEFAAELDGKIQQWTGKREVEQIISTNSNIEERLQRESGIIKKSTPLLMHSVDMFYSFVSSNIVRNGDIISPRCIYLLDARSLMTSNFHLCDIAVGTNTGLLYRCTIRKGAGDEPICAEHPVFVEIACSLRDGSYELQVDQREDRVHTEIRTPKGYWIGEEPLTNSDNTVREVVSEYASKTAKESGYGK